MKKLLFLTSFLLVSSVFAQADVPQNFDIKSIEVVEVPLDNEDMKSLMHLNMGVGDIIATAKDIVGLGQSIYDLVQKGKPSITTEYAAINVVPKDPVTKQFVDPYDLDGTSDPIRKKFVATITNSFNMKVVTFEYMLMFSYGGSYNGKGAYIQNAMIIPISVNVIYGYDFNAQMKLLGISKKGTQDQPVAAEVLAMKYKVSSVGKAIERTRIINITGQGKITLE
jgi:hypothetical protein